MHYNSCFFVENQFHENFRQIDFTKNHDLSYLFTWTIGTLARIFVVVGTSKGHKDIALTFGVVHFIAFFNGNPVHFDGAA